MIKDKKNKSRKPVPKPAPKPKASPESTDKKEKKPKKLSKAELARIDQMINERGDAILTACAKADYRRTCEILAEDWTKFCELQTDLQEKQGVSRGLQSQINNVHTYFPDSKQDQKDAVLVLKRRKDEIDKEINELLQKVQTTNEKVVSSQGRLKEIKRQIGMKNADKILQSELMGRPNAV